MPKIGQKLPTKTVKKVDSDTCVACSGSGLSSGGGRCFPCNGSGRKTGHINANNRTQR